MDVCRLRVWALSQLTKLLAEENSGPMLSPFTKAPEAAVADLFLTPAPIAAAEGGTSIPVCLVLDMCACLSFLAPDG